MEAKKEIRNVAIKDVQDIYQLLCSPDVIGLFDMPDRERKILEMYWSKQMTFDTIAKVFDRTPETIRQLYEIAVQRFKNNIRHAFEVYKNIEAIKAENEDLKSVNRELKGIINALPENRKKELVGLEEIYKIRLEDLETKVSVRVMNVLHALKIITIGDLMRCTPNDLLKERNFGEKSFYELEKLLARYNLKLPANALSPISREELIIQKVNELL